MENLKGKTVVITGASSGVGRAAAEAFALEGCNMVLAARGKDGLDEVVGICHDLGVAAMAVVTDVSKFADVKNLADKALQYNGRIDVWINNAGVMASGKFEEIPMEIHEQVVRTNLMGYLHGAYAVLPQFRKQGDGVLINNVSIGGFMPAPYSAVYSATKFGIRGMVECLHGEVSDAPDIYISNIYPQMQRSTGNMHSAKFSGLKFKVPPIAADPRDTAAEMVKLAKHPKKDHFPDMASRTIVSLYKIFPKTIINTASGAMRIMMKLKNGPEQPGNIMVPSHSPHRIYGETSLPVPSRNTKLLMATGAFLAIAYFSLTGKSSKKNKKKLENL